MSVQKYTSRQYLDKYEKQAANHTKTFMPALRAAFGPLRGKRILDVGCGDGRITAEFSKAGATVIGVDCSAKWIAECWQRYHKPRLSFRVLNATQLTKLPARSFDGVLMNMVLINVDTEQEIKKIIGGVARVLKPRGVFVFSDLHPALKMGRKFPDRRVTYKPGFSYFKDGSQFTAHIQLDKKTEISFIDRHWTLTFYSRLLEKAGLAITRIFEPPRAKGVPHAKQYKVPEFIVFTCRKIASSDNK